MIFLSNELFPYENQYEFYLITVKQYKARTLTNAKFAVTKFWNFYLGGDTNASICNVQESDVRSFFNYAETKIHFKNSTLNKFLVHLKSYFAWLNSHNLIKKLPTLFIDGRPIQRKSTVIINWFPYLEDFLQDNRLDLITKKTLLAISLGFSPNELIKIRNKDVASRLNGRTNTKVTNFNFLISNMDDYYFTSSKHGHIGEPLQTSEVLRRKLRHDNKFLPFKSNLLSLRQSYVYSEVINTALSDDDLLSLLNCNRKTLNYYKDNSLLFDLVDYRTLRKSYLNSYSK